VWGWCGGAGSSRPARHPPPGTLLGRRWWRSARRSPRRSRRRPALGLLALGDRLQERVQFCLHLHHEAGLGRLLLQFAFFPLQAGDPLLARILSGRPRGADSPASAPASRARRHSTMWLEYRPSRRSSAPFSPSGAASYAARTSNLYFAVNVRRHTRSGTSGSGRPVPAPGTRPGSSIPGARWSLDTVIVISGESPSPPSGH
jgi:hypothetical protein